MTIFSPAINDYMVRLAQLDAALGKSSRYQIQKSGLVEQSIRAEIDYLKTRIEETTSMSRTLDGRWRL